jgi:hypothetical protein
MQADMISFLCKKREVENHRHIVALSALGDLALGDVIISRSYAFVDNLCRGKGIICEPSFFNGMCSEQG